MESRFHQCLNTQVRKFINLILLKEKVLHANNPNQQVSYYYMIGDNPSVDIKGGNENGFKTILVRTGVFNEENKDNCDKHPATYCVNDINDAINLIIRLENL